MRLHTPDLVTRIFRPEQFSKIVTTQPKITRRQVIGAAIGSRGIDFAVEQSPVKADEKSAYSPTLQGSHYFQYMASPEGMVLIVGTPGIAKTAPISAAIAGLKAIMAQSGEDASDILFAPVEGELETVVADEENEYISLSALGFTRVAYNGRLNGFIGSREGDNHLYFLSLEKAKSGQWEKENWVKSQKSCSTGLIKSFPYRISSLNLSAVPITTERGLETADLTNLPQGQIRFLPVEPVTARVPIEVLGDTDGQGVLVALPTEGKKKGVVVPRSNFRNALLEMNQAAV